jgi:PhnB protein
MPTHAYIHFQGNCAEALAAYAEIFGGTNLQVMQYGQAPGGAPIPGARIMHAQLTIGEGALMASDFPEGMEGDAQKAVSIMQTAPDVETGQAWFDKLMEGGALIQPYAPTFFAKGFGMVKDRFGTHWMIWAG